MDIPLSMNERGDVLGWDGKQWRPPDDVAQDNGGRRAYRFGDRWQIAPETARAVSAELPSNDSIIDKARVVGTGAVQGVTDAVRAPSGINELGGDAMNWAMRKLGIISKTRAQQQEALRKVGITPTEDRLPSVTKTVESVGLPTDFQAEAKRLNVKGTALDLAAGARALSGAYLSGAGPLWSGLSAVGAGAGHAIGGEEGALYGSLGFPVASALGTGLVRSGARAVRGATAPFTSRGLQGMADRAIVEAAGVPPGALASAARPAPISGQPATLGQLTGNRGLLDAEYALHGKVPAIEDAYRKISGAAGQEMANLAPITERAASAGLRTALTSSRTAAKAPADAAFRSVDAALQGVKTPRAEFAATMKPFIGGLSKAEIDDLPGNIRSMISSLSQTKAVINGQPVTLKNFRLNEITGLRSVAESAAREELQAGNVNRHRLLKGVVGRLDEYVDTVAPQFAPGYAAARDKWRNFKRSYDKDPEIGVLFAKNADGTFKVPASEVGNRVLRMSAEGVERLARLPGIQPKLRDWLATAWTDRATTANAATRASGAPNLAGALKFRQDYDHIFKAAFSKADLQKSDSIIDALKMPTMAEFGQRRFGSPTYNKFVKGTLIEGLVGRLINQVPGGGMFNQALGNFIYSKPIAELEQKIAEALLNPQSTMARLMTMKATPGNAKLLNRYWRAAPGVLVPLSREE